MRFYTIVGLLIGILVAQARAQDDPKICAAISNDAKRLECFDLIFKKSSVTTPVPKSDWIITQEKSKIDDTTNVSITVTSMQPITNQYGQQTNLDMYILCREKKTDFYIVFGGYFMASIENYGKVTFRLDKRPAFQQLMVESTDHKALGLWGGASAIPFIKGLAGGRGFPTPAVLEKRGRDCVDQSAAFIAEEEVPTVRLVKGDVKEEIARKHFRTAERDRRHGPDGRSASPVSP